MRNDGGRTNNFSAGDIVYPALFCALLIGGQYVFSFVAGVEIVTVLLVSFAAVFGVKRGVACAAAFSLLRCLIFGFYPNVVILYLLYYPALAALFGLLGHIKPKTFERSLPVAAVVNALLLGIACACVLLYFLDVVRIAPILKTTVSVLLWVVFALALVLCIAFDALLVFKRIRTAAAMRVILFTSVAAVCTVCFTLLDDIVTPVFYGYSASAALAYFYVSFTAMLPQTVCTIATVCLLFPSVSAVLETVKRRKR